jgi:hypothetical protein
MGQMSPQSQMRFQPQVSHFRAEIDFQPFYNGLPQAIVQSFENSEWIVSLISPPKTPGEANTESDRM